MGSRLAQGGLAVNAAQPSAFPARYARPPAAAPAWLRLLIFVESAHALRASSPAPRARHNARVNGSRPTSISGPETPRMTLVPIQTSPFHPMAPVAVSAINVGPEHARLGVGRVRLDGREPVPVSFEGQAAWYVVFQLKDAPPHRFREDGRTVMAPPSPRGAVHIVDLRREPSAHLQGPFDSFNFHLPQALLDTVSEGGRSRVTALAAPEPWRTPDPIVGRLGRMLAGTLKGQGGRLLRDSLATAFTVHVAERYGDLSRPLVPTGGLAAWQERRAREIIAAELGGEVSLARIAAECRLSVAHFSRAFKASTGQAPYAFLQARRIDHAKALLRGPMPLAEVAAASGFADQSHFTRAFRKAVGAPPGAWRRS